MRSGPQLRMPVAPAISMDEPAPSGGARRDRTDDLLLAKQALSQLSYGPLHPIADATGDPGLRTPSLSDRDPDKAPSTNGGPG